MRPPLHRVFSPLLAAFPLLLAAFLPLGCADDDVSGGPGPVVSDTGSPSDDSDDPSDTDGDTDAPPSDDPDLLWFEEVGVAAGLTHANREHASRHQVRDCGVGNLSTGAVAVGDIDKDGFDDLFFPVHHGADRLYLNRGDGTFEDVTDRTGLPYSRHSSSALITDLDLDGRPDLLIGRLLGEPLQAWLQQPDGSFVDRTAALGLTLPYPSDQCGLTWGLSLGDVDLDGDIDILMGAWADKLRGLRGFGTLLWRRSADGTYRAEELPVGDSYGFAPAIADLDEDGHPDLPIASDFGTNRLLWGAADGQWRDGTLEAGVHTVEAGMGSVLLDLDADGDLDWFVTSVFDPRDNLPDGQPRLGNMAYLNRGDRTFVDQSAALGLQDSRWGWGIAAADLDLDGLVDLTVTNGYDEGEASHGLYGPFVDDPTRLYRRDTPDGPFRDVATATGLIHTAHGRAIVAFDLENDGDDDLLIVNHVGRPTVFRNAIRSSSGSVTVRLSQDGSNPDGLGSQVWIQHDPDAPSLRHDIHGNGAFLSQVPPRVRVGLGIGRPHLHRVVVVWPDGEEQEFHDVQEGSLDVRR